MPQTDRHSATTPHSGHGAVLVLTDGSTWANRVAEWGLVFADASQATIHRIDVMDCFNSGVIIHRYTAGQDQACTSQTTGRQPTNTNDTERGQRRGRESTIDVLHGIPHEAIRDYAVTHAVDLIIICVRERVRSEQTFLGDTLTRVTHRTTIPTMTVEQPTEVHESQSQHEQYGLHEALGIPVRTGTE